MQDGGIDDDNLAELRFCARSCTDMGAIGGGAAANNNCNNRSSNADFCGTDMPIGKNGHELLAASVVAQAVGLRKAKNRNTSNSRLVAGLTFLQFLLAVYATFLLYFMSPTVDLMSETAGTWTSHITKRWEQLTNPSLMLNNSSRHHSKNRGGWSIIGGYGYGGAGGGSDIRRSLFNFNNARASLRHGDACEFERIGFEQKKSNDSRMLAAKQELFMEIVEFQQRTRDGCETLEELMALPSAWSRQQPPKITVILNHFKRKTLCAQLDALLEQTVPVHKVWVMAFGSPSEASFRAIIEMYNDSRIRFVSANYDFKYYGRFQMALQAGGADYVYILDDDMIPGRRMLEILSHVAGTQKYSNAVLGSIGRILPFRQRDYSFPSYRKYGVKEAGLYLPDPAYNILIDRILQVDFLSSSWFLSADLVKTIFIETPPTFATGEDLHLSYQLQKYRDAGSFVVPIDPADKSTWGDTEHRLAQISETTVIFKDMVQVRDDQWWRTFSRGYVTQWAKMYPQQTDALIYAHTLEDVEELLPILQRFRSTPHKKAFLIIPGGSMCPCHKAAMRVGWVASACRDRRFKIFDLELGSIAASMASESTIVQEIYGAIKGLLQIHSPALILAADTIPTSVRDAFAMAVSNFGRNTSLVLLPRNAIPHSAWIASLRLQSLQAWSKMSISVNIITQNRPKSLRRLLDSLSSAYYLGDKISLTFNMDSRVDNETLTMVNQFTWPHGAKQVRRRIIQGGLVRAVSESWYPATDDDYGLLLEDDIEVSRFYYMWLKYTLLAYNYDPSEPLPELCAIALYTPRLVEVVKERPKWNATNFFKSSTPYLHQLPCSWGSLFFPKHWREFYSYMHVRFTEDAKQNPVQIPRSRTNGWQASWKKFLIDMMYLRGYVALYPNFPQQASFSTNHMEAGAHINASGNALRHNREDYEVPLLQEPDFWTLLPQQKLPSARTLPVLNLFNQPTTLRGLKASGSKLRQDVLRCQDGEIVAAHPITGMPDRCSRF